mgnify:CR=1 FL=1
MKNVFVATSNLHKVDELKLISPDWINLKPISDLIINFDADETGSTFIENSVIDLSEL